MGHVFDAVGVCNDWIKTPQKIFLSHLDYGCPVGLYVKKHAYTDEGGDIINAYV